MKSLNIIPLGALAISLAIAAPSLAQDDVQIKTQKLSETISVLFGQGGNIGVSAGADGVFIIDDQFAPLTDKIKAAIAELSDKPVNYVINTHWHFDHTGGNENFGKGGAAIIAHDNARIRMTKGGYVKAAGRHIAASPKDALPVITFNDKFSLHLNGEEARMIHVADAHTDGDGIIYFKKSNIVHMGDTFLSIAYPFIDRDSGGSIDGIIAGAKTVLALIDDKTQIIPGHGHVSDKATLQAFMEMCIAMRDKVTALKKNGMTLESVLASDPTAGFHARWGGRGDKWNAMFITAIYDGAK